MKRMCMGGIRTYKAITQCPLKCSSSDDWGLIWDDDNDEEILLEVVMYQLKLKKKKHKISSQPLREA
ncbi:unnamed protein product [Arabis nemorensis]|uniref:Uncharacterized protein n=1 Tax=Arabis nemorensis TaxID=586526 RepID=A0A565BJA0_9BRAS|nr:unnamed protein product [Arabis nemorensis]